MSKKVCIRGHGGPFEGVTLQVFVWKLVGPLSLLFLLKGGTVVYNGLVGLSSTDTSDWSSSSSRGGRYIQLYFDRHLRLEAGTEKLFFTEH